MSDNEDDDNDKLDTSNLSDELAKLNDDLATSSSISNAADDDDDPDGSLQGDTWIEELECALLADCDPATLKKISEGKRIPTTLRPDYWRALLALNDAGKMKLNCEYDLENQLEIRQDCESLVEDIAINLATEALSEADKLRLKSDFESTLTTYVKARPELSYIPGNGWTDILRVLYHLELSDVQLYQMFFRIVDRYIPKDLSHRPSALPSRKLEETTNHSSSSNNIEVTSDQKESKNVDANTKGDDKNPQTKAIAAAAAAPIPKASSESNLTAKRLDSSNKSIQAYHLLRLLIQYHDPELCSILDSRKVTPNLYVKDWFCSLFARSCTPKLALIIWDTHFKMADPFLIFFAAIVMVANAGDELKKSNMTQADMLKILNAMPSKLEEDDIDDLYYLVSNHYTNATPRSIRSYSHLFFMDTFGNTYSGNESPEESPPLYDLKTSQLTNSLDLSQYLCLPIVPAEIFALDTAKVRSSPTNSPTSSSSSLKYFLVDCRPAEQYNAGHLARAFHLDCSLMLREPSSFATAVQALLEIQRQVVASKSNTGGQHLCFIGSGQEEEDQYVNMVVASFLQKYQKYVSIVVGGFEAMHNYVNTKSELRESFNKYIVDHNPELCKICCNSKATTNIVGGGGPNNNRNLPPSGIGSSAQSLFASTTSFLRGESSGSFSKFATSTNTQATANLIAQSGASMFDKFTTAFVSKSSIIKDRLVETLNTTTIPTPSNLASPSSSTFGGRDHVSSHDKLGRRYTGSNSGNSSASRYAIDDVDDNDLSLNRRNSRGIVGRNSDNTHLAIGEPIQEIQIESWQKQANIIAFHKCAQIKGTTKYPGYIALSKTHFWILREIPHNKGFASIAAKRPLDMIVQITSKRRQPDLIIFRYGYANHQQSSNVGGSEDKSMQKEEVDKQQQNANNKMPLIVASDQLHIPQAFEVIRLIKREIVRIMDENSKRVGKNKEEVEKGVINTTTTVESETSCVVEKDAPVEKIDDNKPKVQTNNNDNKKKNKKKVENSEAEVEVEQKEDLQPEEVAKSDDK